MPSDYQLVKDRAVCADDWVYLEDDAALGDAPSIISLDRLRAESDALKARNAPLGVVLRADNQGKQQMGEDVHELSASYLDMVQLVAIEFPVYRNGRGYSNARILREQLGFTGELRATGEVLHDQWQFMERCGFNAFELAPHISLEEFTAALGELSDAYQPADRQPARCAVAASRAVSASG